MIPAEVRERLEGKLAAFEKETGAQVAVLTIDTLGGDVLEDYSLKVAQTWKLGRKGVDDGVLLLIVKDDRKLRIEVGYGLEGKLTDAQCGRILDDVVRPEFRNGDFGRGVEAGVDAIIGMIQGKDTIPSRAPGTREASFGGPAGRQAHRLGCLHPRHRGVLTPGPPEQGVPELVPVRFPGAVLRGVPPRALGCAWGHAYPDLGDRVSRSPSTGCARHQRASISSKPTRGWPPLRPRAGTPARATGGVRAVSQGAVEASGAAAPRAAGNSDQGSGPVPRL